MLVSFYRHLWYVRYSLTANSLVFWDQLQWCLVLPSLHRRHHLQNSVEILNSLTLITHGDPGLCILDVISTVYFIIFNFWSYCFFLVCLFLLLSLKSRHSLNYPLPHQGFLSMAVFSKYCLNFQCSLSLEYIYWLFYSITHFRNTNYGDYRAFLSAHDIQIYTLPFVAYYRRWKCLQMTILYTDIPLGVVIRSTLYLCCSSLKEVRTET